MTEHDHEHEVQPAAAQGNAAGAEALQQPQPLSEQEAAAIRTQSRELLEQYGVGQSDVQRPQDSRLYAGSFQSYRNQEQCGDCAQAGVRHFENDGGMTLALAGPGDQARLVRLEYQDDDPPEGAALQLGDLDWLLFDDEAARDRTVYLQRDELSDMGLHDAMQHPENVPDLGKKWAEVVEYARAERAKRRPA